jgi:hypothetical protein
MGLDIRKLAWQGGFALALAAFAVFFFLSSFFHDSRPHVAQPEYGYIYQFQDKGLEDYISATDVNEARLLWVMILVGFMTAIWFSGSSRTLTNVASVNSLFPRHKIVNQPWVDKLFFLFATLVFVLVILLLGPPLCSVLARSGIIILPPLTG